MGHNSGIHWTDDTFNPWWGCTKISPACDECYADGMATRWAHDIWGPDAPRRFFGDKHWNEPLKWNRLAESTNTRRRCFSGSMCDIMERHHNPEINAQMDDCRTRLYNLTERTPWLDWLFLTKRPQEFRKKLPIDWLGLANPRPNVWLMTTVEHQDYIWRLKELMTAPAIVYGVSIEPIYSEIKLPKEFLDRGNRAWVILGGKTGPTLAPVNVEWARNLRDVCLEAGVPFHFKQWGDANSEGRRVGAKHAGRMLDGREWDGVPLDPANNVGRYKDLGWEPAGTAPVELPILT